jgi:ribosomal protein S20
VEAARAQYKATESNFRSKVRTAVKEVEDALVRLDSAAERQPQAHKAVSGYRTNFLAVQELYQAGLGNLIDVETARRNVLSAEMAVKELEQEQVSAWIALYRAAGGSWDEPEDVRKVGGTIVSDHFLLSKRRTEGDLSNQISPKPSFTNRGTERLRTISPVSSKSESEKPDQLLNHQVDFSRGKS